MEKALIVRRNSASSKYTLSKLRIPLPLGGCAFSIFIQINAIKKYFDLLQKTDSGVPMYSRESVAKRGPRKGEWPLWGEEKPRYRWNFLLAENGTLYLVL